MGYSRRQVLGLAGAAAACAVGAGAGAALGRAERASGLRGFPGSYHAEPLWRFRVADPRHALLTAAGDVVYVTCPRVDKLYSLRTEDGSVMWEAAAGQGMPVIHGNLVYTEGYHGGLSAWGMADGGKRWDFQAGNAALAAPVFDGPVAYVGVSVPAPLGERGGIWALDAQAGTPLWQVPSAIDTASSPDSPVTVAGDTLYTSSGFMMRALDKSNGAERWRYYTPNGPFSAAPQVVGDIVCGGADSTLFALSARSGEPLWSSDYPAAIFAMEAIGGTIYAAGCNGTGGGAYPDEGTVVISALTVMGGKQVWMRTDNLDEIFVISGGTALICTHPAEVADGIAYPGGASGETELRAVRLSDGRPKWQITGSGWSLTSPPALAQGWACIGFMHESIRVVSLETGEIRWHLPMHVVSGPVAGDRMVFAVGANAVGPDDSASAEGFVYGVPM